MRAISELGVKSPLLEAGLTKAEIRLLSRGLGLTTWDKPSFACLASRFPYGDRLTEQGLRTVGNAEKKLHELGFAQARVRHHGNIARVELEKQDIPRAASPEISEEILSYFRELGFTYVTLDLAGYSTGSMNKDINRTSN